MGTFSQKKPGSRYGRATKSEAYHPNESGYQLNFGLVKFENTYGRIKEFLESSEFAQLARVEKSDFTRSRSLPLPLLVTMLLNLRKWTIQDELDRFFEVLSDQPLAQGVTASAFCQARKKLNPLALAALSSRLVMDFHKHFALHRWRGFRLLAVDGSTARLPHTPDVVANFGEPPKGASVPLARLSCLYDVLNGVMIEADIVARSEGERVLAGEHLAATHADDLLLYDRGYPAFLLFALHAIERRHFCARVPVGFSNEVKAFVDSAQTDARVVFAPSDQARRQCAIYALPDEVITLRLIRVNLPSGEIEVLVTSLLNNAAFPTDCFAELYHKRWGIEESYLTQKYRLEIENFSGKSAQAVRQDFYAKLFTLNLTAIIAWVAQAIAERRFASRRRLYTVNFANAVSKMKDNVVRLFLACSARELITRLASVMANAVEAVRPGRSFPRNFKKTSQHQFHPNLKGCR